MLSVGAIIQCVGRLSISNNVLFVLFMIPSVAGTDSSDEDDDHRTLDTIPEEGWYSVL